MSFTNNYTIKKLKKIISEYINNQSVSKDLLVIIDEYISKLNNKNIRQAVQESEIKIPREILRGHDKSLNARIRGFIRPALTDATIQDAVWEYIRGGPMEKQSVVTKYGDISNWDVSKVTNMKKLFHFTPFNQPLNKWNVSNVTNMNGMFEGAKHFNQPLNNWNVSNVITMKGMFRDVESFNQSLNNWDVSKVTNMIGMFSGSCFTDAISFNQPLNKWNVSNVTNMAMMFAKATSFNQPLNNWNVSQVTNMAGMFNGARFFNQPLNNWNVSKEVTNMAGMFQGATIIRERKMNFKWNVPIINSNHLSLNTKPSGYSYVTEGYDSDREWNRISLRQVFKSRGKVPGVKYRFEETSRTYDYPNGGKETALKWTWEVTSDQLKGTPKIYDGEGEVHKIAPGEFRITGESPTVYNNLFENYVNPIPDKLLQEGYCVKAIYECLIKTERFVKERSTRKRSRRRSRSWPLLLSEEIF